MSRHKVYVIDFNGAIQTQLKSEIIEGDYSEMEAIKEACRRNKEFAKIAENEPKGIDYPADSNSPLNSEEIKNGWVVVACPL